MCIYIARMIKPDKAMYPGNMYPINENFNGYEFMFIP